VTLLITDRRISKVDDMQRVP